MDFEFGSGSSPLYMTMSLLCFGLLYSLTWLGPGPGPASKILLVCLNSTRSLNLHKITVYSNLHQINHVRTLFTNKFIHLFGPTQKLLLSIFSQIYINQYDPLLFCILFLINSLTIKIRITLIVMHHRNT